VCNQHMFDSWTDSQTMVGRRMRGVRVTEGLNKLGRTLWCYQRPGWCRGQLCAARVSSAWLVWLGSASHSSGWSRTSRRCFSVLRMVLAGSLDVVRVDEPVATREPVTRICVRGRCVRHVICCRSTSDKCMRCYTLPPSFKVKNHGDR
jgi:hypothetical protein